MNLAEGRTADRDGYPPPALTAAVLALIALVLAIWAVAAIAETSTRATERFAPVAATVVDERTEMRLVADRRGSTLEPFRVVTVELPDGTGAEVRSDDLTVGVTATVYRSDAGAALAAAATVVAVAAVRCVRRLRPSA